MIIFGCVCSYTDQEEIIPDAYKFLDLSNFRYLFWDITSVLIFHLSRNSFRAFENKSGRIFGRQSFV